MQMSDQVHKVDNSAVGWKHFAETILYTQKKWNGTIIASLDMEEEFDDNELLNLQYFFVELDRIEYLRGKTFDSVLRIHVKNEKDAFRILTYLGIMEQVRARFKLIVMCKEEQIVSKKDALYEQTYGRIFPLFCVGAITGSAVVPYRYLVMPSNGNSNKIEKFNGFGQKAAEAKELRNNETALAALVRYYLENADRIERDLSGTGRKKLYETPKKRLVEEIETYLKNGLPQMGLIAKVLWVLFLWNMTLTKELLHLNGEEKWELDEEAMQCTRMDALSYAEGILQLLENACVHSKMKRAYVSFRVHYTDITSTGLNALEHTTAVRVALRKRLQQPHFNARHEQKAGYELKPDVKYYLEIFVLNDSMEYYRNEDGTVEEGQLCGISERFCQNRKMKQSLRLNDVFAYRGTDLDQIAQHYGLRTLEKVVRLNGGYFGVCSPAMHTAKQNDSYECYRSFDGIQEEQALDLFQTKEHCTYYDILLPLVSHWADFKGANQDEEISDAQGLFDTSSLNTSAGNYEQQILKFEVDTFNQLKVDGAEEQEFLLDKVFLEVKSIQHPQAGKQLAKAVMLPSVNNKPQMVQWLISALKRKLQNKKKKMVWLLDLMQLGDFLCVEMIAKMMFYCIASAAEAEKQGEKESNNTGPTPLFALLFPEKEYIWEFFRIFSIFYDKNTDHNSWMGRAQVALCSYREEKQDTPEICFLIAGRTAEQARITARVFSYYNMDATMEMIPQIQYLTRDQEADKHTAILQFPFDLYLTAAPANAKEQSGESWFLRTMKQALEKDLWLRPHGCRIRNIRVRLKSNIYVSDFYEAELLFHNVGIIYRFAYLIAQDLFRQTCNNDWKGPLVIVGYEFYSSVLTEQITTLLRKVMPKREIHYLIYSDRVKQRLHISPELQLFNPGDLNELLKRSAYTAILPIGTTMSTLYRIMEAVDVRTKQCGTFPFFHYVLILVGDSTGDSKTDLAHYFWNKQFGKKMIELMPQVKAPKRACPKSLFYLEPKTEWHESRYDGAKCAAEEKVLVYVDQTSTRPKEIFVGADTRFRGTSFFIPSNRAVSKNQRRLELLKGCIHYGHLIAGNNHFQFYIDMERYFAKANSKLTDVSISQWLCGLRHHINPAAYNIIVSPLHREDSPFAKAVIDNVFEHSLRFLHIDLFDAFREDIRAKFSYLAEEYKRIRRFDCSKAVDVYFVNTAITSGQTLLRARNLLMMLLEESGMPYNRNSIFKGCFVMVNRSAFDTVNSYVEDPVNNFHAYLHLAVPTFNVTQDGCPTCALVKQYRTIEKRSTNNCLGKEFHRLAEKHCKRSIEEYHKWMEDTVMISGGYAGWLRQWLYAYVRSHAAAENNTIGIFDHVPQKEVQRMKKLYELLRWGLEKYLEEKQITWKQIEQDKASGSYTESSVWEMQEQYLETIGAFTLTDLKRYVDSNHDELMEKYASNSDDMQCLEPDYWKKIVITYVCGQKNYLRLEALHRSYLAMDNMPEKLDTELQKRANQTEQVIRQLIEEQLESVKSKGLDLRIEWLISYLKVLSRPHLSQYHHIRQGILQMMLSMIEYAVKQPTTEMNEVPSFYNFLRDDRTDGSAPNALVQYQLLQTLLKRLSGLQSSYFLYKSNMSRIIQVFLHFREKHFKNMIDSNMSAQQKKKHMEYMWFNPFPSWDEMERNLVKLIKWTSSGGEDENGAFLIEKEFLT